MFSHEEYVVNTTTHVDIYKQDAVQGTVSFVRKKQALPLWIEFRNLVRYVELINRTEKPANKYSFFLNGKCIMPGSLTKEQVQKIENQNKL